MKVAQIVVRIRQKALIPPRMYSSFPCGLALPLTMALTFSVREPAEKAGSHVCSTHTKAALKCCDDGTYEVARASSCERWACLCM